MSEIETTTGNRLRVGDVFSQNGKHMVVWFANDSRAAVAVLGSKIAVDRSEKEGKEVIRFKADESENISPNSEVSVTKSLGREGLARLLDKRARLLSDEGETKSKEKTETKSKEKKAKKPAKEKKPSSRGQLWEGHAVTAVLRAIGKARWSFEEARTFVDEEKLHIADGTIRTKMGAGRTAKKELETDDGFPIAPVADELTKMRNKLGFGPIGQKKDDKAKPAAKGESKKKTAPKASKPVDKSAKSKSKPSKKTPAKKPADAPASEK